MWDLISAFVSLVIGAATPTLPGGLPYTAPYINQGSVSSCYQPDPSDTITLDISSFSNVSNLRPVLNPKIWSSDPLGSTFTSDTTNLCKNTLLGGTAPGATRTFMLVRRDVRISSCKTDELVGPFAQGMCAGWNNNAVQMTHRGSCDTKDYTDLRKIADVQRNGQTLEIFWNPFSYNVGCDYKANENCGPGSRQNMNLKDFIYVVKKRDSFDSASHPGCVALWDAGSTNENACSHYFDVYLATDMYDQMQQTTTIPTDHNSEMYFLKQIVENCQENTTFIPAPNANQDIPPTYIDAPFVLQSNIGGSNLEKFLPGTPAEESLYNSYIWTKQNIFFDDAGVSLHLVKQGSNTNPIPLCAPPVVQVLAVGDTPTPTLTPVLSPTLAPPSDCFDQLGSISFTRPDASIGTFTVYSNIGSPQTFLFKSLDDPNTYEYTVTNASYPQYKPRHSTLQLGNLPFITKNAWTWATPWCKPAIYLYPQKPIDVNVKLALDGNMTVSEPQYDSANGWVVHASPDGKLSTSNNLPLANNYLYYEADLNNVEIPKNGFIIPQMNLSNELSGMLRTLGFNNTESNDFLKYWLPRLTDRPYYFVTLLPESTINQKEALDISVKPDSIIRSRFVFEGLDTPMKVDPLVIPSHQRKGFTLTDWGGTLVGKSCTDITVK